MSGPAVWLNALPRRSRTAGCPWLKRGIGEQKERREEEPVTAVMISSENRECVPGHARILWLSSPVDGVKGRLL